MYRTKPLFAVKLLLNLYISHDLRERVKCPFTFVLFHCGIHLILRLQSVRLVMLWFRENDGPFSNKFVMMTSSNGNIFRVIGPLCGDSTVAGEFPAPRPVARSFDVFVDLRLNKRLSKHSRRWWFVTPLLLLRRHCVMSTNLLEYIDPGPYDRLISTMGFPILVRLHLYIESRPSSLSMADGWGLLILRSLISPRVKFSILQKCLYIIWITFVFDRCHRSWAAATSVKHQRYIQ